MAGREELTDETIATICARMLLTGETYCPNCRCWYEMSKTAWWVLHREFLQGHACYSCRIAGQGRDADWYLSMRKKYQNTDFYIYPPNDYPAYARGNG